MVGQVWKVMPIILELRRPRQEVQELEDSGVACPCTCGGQGATGGSDEWHNAQIQAQPVRVP